METTGFEPWFVHKPMGYHFSYPGWIILFKFIGRCYKKSKSLGNTVLSKLCTPFFVWAIELLNGLVKRCFERAFAFLQQVAWLLKSTKDLLKKISCYQTIAFMTRPGIGSFPWNTFSGGFNLLLNFKTLYIRKFDLSIFILHFILKMHNFSREHYQMISSILNLFSIVTFLNNYDVTNRKL